MEGVGISSLRSRGEDWSGSLRWKPGRREKASTERRPSSQARERFLKAPGMFLCASRFGNTALSSQQS